LGSVIDEWFPRLDFHTILAVSSLVSAPNCSATHRFIGRYVVIAGMQSLAEPETRMQTQHVALDFGIACGACHRAALGADPLQRAPD